MITYLIQSNINLGQARTYNLRMSALDSAELPVEHAVLHQPDLAEVAQVLQDGLQQNFKNVKVRTWSPTIGEEYMKDYASDQSRILVADLS